MDACSECRFVYESLPTAEIGSAIRGMAGPYREVLLQPGVSTVATVRPSPDMWSALEYCCHVRDVLLVQRDRVLLALVEDVPSFARMYRDERVVLAGYGQESLGGSVTGLGVAADLLARVFEEQSPEQLGRGCVYNYPSPLERDIAWLGRHAVHEGRHHLHDIRSVLERVGGASR